MGSATNATTKTNAVRSALLVGRDPDDPSRRVIAPVKQNLCEPAPAVAFSLVLVTTGKAVHGRRPPRRACA